MKWAATVASMAAILVSVPAHASETITYSYDALGRMVGSAHSGTVNNGQQASVTYDAADNRSAYSINVPTPVLAIGNASATEGSNLTFTVTRSGDTSGAVSVNWATANGTAMSGSDFAAGSGTLNFAAGQTTSTITVATIDDTVVESTETMTVTLSGPTGGATLTTATGTGTITDNDVAPTLAIGNASATEGANLAFTVTRSGNTTGSSSVNWATANGSALAGSDYVAGSGTLNFAAGETSKSITVSTIDDTITENTETMTVNLTTPSSATISTATGIGTILDNDTGWSSSMTAGTETVSCVNNACSMTVIGYDSGATGSMTHTAWTNYTITGVYSINGYGALRMSGASAPPNSGWTSVTISGVGTFARSAASYSTSGNVAFWSWPSINFTSGSTYTITIQ